MAVKLDGDLYRFLQRFNQFPGAVWSKQARHILNADGVNSRIFQLLGIIRKIRQVKDGTCRIADSSLHVRICLFSGLN